MHAVQQNVQCRACHRNFAKGAGLLLHFEQNQCHTIKANNNPDMVVDQRAMLEAHRAMMAVELHVQEGMSPTEKKALSQAPSISMTESIDGGVRIPTSLLDDPEGEQEFQGMINLQSPMFPSNTSTSQQSDTASVASTVREQGPDSVQSSSNWSKKLFPGAENTPITGEWASASEMAESVKSSPTNLHSVNPTESGIHVIDQSKILKQDPMDRMYHCAFQLCE